MPKFTIANLLKTLAVFADISAIIYIFFNVKAMSINDPAIQILFYSALATLTFFLAPFIHGKMETKRERMMFTITTILLLSIIVFCWLNLGRNKELDDSKMYSVVLNKGIISKHLPAPLKPDTPTNKPIPENKKAKPNIVKKIYHPVLHEQKKDTVKTTAKFNLQNPTFNAPTQLGDNNTQYNSVPHLPQRTIDNDWVDRLLSRNHKHLPVQITYYPNNECFNVYSSLRAKLTERGYKVTFMTSWSSIGNDKIRDTIEASMGDTVLYVRIYKQEK